MDWKEAAEEAVEDIRQDGLRGAAHDLNEEYGFDQKEFGKIVFISSLALFVTSVPAAMTLQETHSTVESANDNLNQVESVINSERFQRNLEVMEERVSGDIGRTLSQVSDSMRVANRSVTEIDSAESELEESSTTYKWMSLVSIMGMVGGIVVSYI